MVLGEVDVINGGDKVAGETKKEHYVPQCYLERWKNEKGKIAVFDKELRNSRFNSVADVACKRYYYDIDPERISNLRADMLEKFGIDTKHDPQFIEHFLGEHVEGRLSKLLTKIVSKAESTTPWYEKNCYFISEIDKVEFSICLAFQYIRTDSVRKSVADSSDCLKQVLKEMDASQEVIDKYTIKQDEEKDVHGNMLLDFKQIEELAEGFYSLTWILGVNRTEIPFYTSDNPIGTMAHVKHPFMSMSGIRSEGVEVFFPLSPKHVLIMYDGSYHKHVEPYERKYLSLTVLENIEYYNLLSIYESDRCVFSCNDDFHVIDAMLKENPNVFDIPKIQISYGGKEYRPNRQ